MDYHLFYDLDTAGYTAWPFVAVGVGLTLCGLFINGAWRASGYRLSSRRVWSPRLLRCFAYAFIAFGMLWTIAMFAGTFTDYWQLRRALDTGSCAVAEGVVTHFIPAAQSRTHSQTESFSVGAQRFAYSDYVVTAGFHLTSKRGGPIRQGLHVRVHHRNGEIARLEIAE